MFTGSGNEFRVDQANGAFTDEALTVDGGNGHDTRDGGDGVEFFIGGNGRDAVDGNRGNDTALLGTDGTSSVGTRVTAAMSSRARTAPTLDFNGAGVDEIMSCRPTASGRCSSAAWATSAWT